MRRLLLPLLAALLVAAPALAVPACAAEVLHRPSDNEPDTLDPQKTASSESIGIDRDLFVGLLALSPTLQPVPGIARTWEVSPDGTLWTFHLRPDAKWSDGTPLTAEDFVYTFRRLADPLTAASDPTDIQQVVNAKAILAGQEKDLTRLGVAAPDPHTFTVRLTEPRAIFRFLMTDPQVFPVPRAAIEKWGAAWTRPGHIVSDGAYAMTSWTPQADIVLERNPLFYDAATVRIGEVHWLDASDLEAAARRFRAGELDWTRLNRTTLPWAKANLPGEVLTVPSNGIYFLYFNMAKGVLAGDIRLREAINLAIDRDVLVKRIDPRGEQPGYGIVSPVLPGYTPQTMPFKAMPMAGRIARAKALMAAAGYGAKRPLHVTMSYPTGEAGKQTLTAIRQMLAPIGVDMALDNMEWQVFVHRTDQRDFDMGFMGTEGSYMDFEPSVGNFWSKAGIFNYTGWSSPKFDALYEAGMTERDEAKRRADIEAAERAILADFPSVPLEYDVNVFLVNPKLQGFLGNVRFPQSRYLSFKDSAS